MRIVSAALGEVTRVAGDVFGDTWSTCEGPDGQLYAAADDTRGFGGVCSSNLAVNILNGQPPQLTGRTVNPMTQFGGMCETGPDLGNWKANGITAVDGSVLLSVSRHRYMAPPFWQQDAWDASVIRSDDGGETWSTATSLDVTSRSTATSLDVTSRSPAPRLGEAMFPGRAFATPWFIDYGAHTPVAPHGADEYVYALSSNGYWNNGNAMTLGRVPRDLITRLDPADWQYASGFVADPNPDPTDRQVGEPVWRDRVDLALPVFQAPGRTGMAGATWVAPLGLYVLPQWHFPYLDRPNPARWQHSRWELFSATRPWGPWTSFFTAEFAPQGFYNPSIPSRFISEDGRTLWILTCGD
ncbi:MAG: hypothetical protein QOE61_4204, partial [Micromonosporaceae bacterium]|nr:hypothetical protein [Micromonosporaceae bacterium]